MTGKTDLLQASTELNMPHFRTAVVFMASALALSACSISDSLDDLATSDQSDESSSVDSSGGTGDSDGGTGDSSGGTDDSSGGTDDSSGGTGDSNGSASFPDAPPRPDDSRLVSVSEVQQGAESELQDLGSERPYNGDLVALLENIRDTSEVTPNSDALAGQASYTGGVIAPSTAEENVSLLADLSMDVDFDDGSVNGAVSGLQTLGEAGTVETVDGTASIDGTVTGNVLEADVDGQVSAGGVDATVVGAMAGEFRGTDADEVAGVTALNINASDFDGTESFDGGFHATKD
jgi:hypothetical protein